MNYILVISILLIFVSIFYIVVYFIKKRVNFKRALNLAFLRVTLPKRESDLDEKKETTKDFKEMVGLMEQLLSSLKSLYSGQIISKIIGQDVISFEYVSHESEILFYIVVPKKHKNLIEKQIN
jgi:hypothetical protein